MELHQQVQFARRAFRVMAGPPGDGLAEAALPQPQESRKTATRVQPRAGFELHGPPGTSPADRRPADAEGHHPGSEILLAFFLVVKVLFFLLRLIKIVLLVFVLLLIEVVVVKLLFLYVEHQDFLVAGSRSGHVSPL